MDKYKNLLRSKNNIYIFPALVITALFILTALRISGTSIGIYDYFFGLPKDSSFVQGDPRGIRSDEWLVMTQLTLAQEKNDYKTVNDNIGDGKDVSLIADVPYVDWSMIFKPQNLSFFVLPFENAFAFKWWFLLSAMLLSIYFFALRFLKEKYLISSLIAVAFSFTPFIFWWYQTITIMPIVWALLGILIVIRIFDNKPFKLLKNTPRPLLITQSLLALLLTYVLVSFALLLYPAFQIIIAIAAGLFVVGYFLNIFFETTKKKRKDLIKTVAFVVTGGVLAVAIVGVFLASRLDTIHDIANTVYPGKRDVASGQFNKNYLFNFLGFTQFSLEDDKLQGGLPNNQSESSTFMLLSVVFFVPTIALTTWYYVKKRKVDWILVGIIVCNLIFIGHLILPWFTPIAKLLLLNTVPQIRLFIGFGVLAIINLVYILYFIDKHRRDFPKATKWYYLGYSGLFFAGCILAALLAERYFPLAITSTKWIVLAAAIYALGIILILTKWRAIGLAVICLFGYASVDTVQPLYAGLSPVYKGELTQKIARHSGPDAVWGATDQLYLENLPVVAGAKSIGGTQLYPDNKFWDSVDDHDTDQIYNRYAHVMITTTQETPLHLVQADYFTAKLACGNRLHATITNIVGTKKLDLPCYKQIDTVHYPGVTVYLYERLPL